MKFNAVIPVRLQQNQNQFLKDRQETEVKQASYIS